MNWQKVSTIISILTALVVSIWWVGNNIVLSAEFNTYKDGQQVKWLKREKTDIWQQYIDLRMLPNKTERDDKRILELERDRLDLEAEIESLRK